MPATGVYLTFDDGPHPTATPEVLAVLQRYKANATFFVSGAQCVKRTTLLKEIADAGHTLGNHGFRHSRLPALSVEQSKSEIVRTEDVLRSVLPVPKKLYRPPYGFFTWNTLAAARNLGYQTVMWSVLTGDFRRKDATVVLATALKNLSAGAILVFHDNDLTQGRIGNILSECIERIHALGHETVSM